MRWFIFAASLGSAGLLAACETNAGLTAEEMAIAQAERSGQVNEAGEALICRVRPVTGSRLRGERTCRTAAEWRAYEEEARRDARSAAADRGAIDYERRKAESPF